MGSKDVFNDGVALACQTRNTLQSLLVKLPQAKDEDRLLLERSIAPAFSSYQGQIGRLVQLHESEASSLTVREVSRRERELAILKTDLSLLDNGLKTNQLHMHILSSPQEELNLERLEEAVHGVLVTSKETYEILKDDNRYLTNIGYRMDWERVELTSLTQRAKSLTDATSEKCMVYMLIVLVVFLALQLILL